MGWTSYHADFYKNNGEIDRKKEMDSFFKEEDSYDGKSHFKTLKSAMVGSTYYAAIERIEKATKDRMVFAVIVLTSVNMSDYYNFSYKDMDETMAPYQYDCPIGILDLLTDTDNEMALSWRNKCRVQRNVKNNLTKVMKMGTGSQIIYIPNIDLKDIPAGSEIILTKGNSGWNDGVYRYPQKILIRGSIKIIKEVK